MKISELAKIANVSKRTLHYYDEIGLLTPTSTDKNGYRIYSEQNIDDLQQILFFRQLDLPLKDIKQIMTDPTFDARKALHVHKQILLQKRKKMDELLRTVDKTLEKMKGMREMSHDEKFVGFDFTENKYEAEARNLYGDEAVERMEGQDGAMFSKKMNELFAELATLRHRPVADELVQAKMAEWYQLVNEMGSYSYEAFSGLGQLYIADERFTQNIDQFGEGLAAWMAKAMKVYADTNR